MLVRLLTLRLPACIFFLYRRNIFNEWLVRDTSKKIRAVKRSKGMSGKPVTSKPVYGYLMDEDENFIIDEEAAPVVKQIYSLSSPDFLRMRRTPSARQAFSSGEPSCRFRAR